MGRKYEFGKTWWGKEWIKALESIDEDTNRLPRGRSYAKNGHVISINISSDAVVNARVQGTRPRPYREKIRMNLFGVKEIEKIQEIINLRPDLASQLLVGNLPEELNELLEEKGVHLFPRSWKEIDAECTCPDWANPCKHLAAVYYIIAQELDKDPFLIFELHGVSKDRLMDMAKIVGKKNDSMFIGKTQVRDTKEMQAPALPEEEYDVEKSLRILEDNPPFYQKGNFKEILKKFYKTFLIVQTQKELFRETKSPYLKETEFQVLYLPDGPFIKINGDITELPFSKKKIPFSTFYNFMSGISVFDNKNDSKSVRFFKKAFAFSYTLLKMGAIIPKAVKINENGDFKIEYHPALHDNAVRAYLDYLNSIAPKYFVVNKDGMILKRNLVADYIVSLILSEYIKSLNIPKEDKITKTFFNGEVFEVKKFEDKHIFTSVSNWLEPFYVGGGNYSIVVLIEEQGKNDKFTLHLGVQNNQDPLESPMTFSKFRNSNASFADKENIMKQLGIIAKYSPFTAKVAKYEKPISLTLEELGKFITKGRFIFEILGVKVLLPKEFKNILKPSLTLNASLKNGNWKKTYMNLTELLDFNWEISIDGETISFYELLKLSKKSSEIIKLRNKYLLVDTDELHRIVKRIEEGIPSISNYEAVQAILGGELGGVKIDFSKDLKEFLKSFRKVKNIRPPKTLKNTQLRKYQERGFKWLYTYLEKGLGVCLADDMGLGKTIQAISTVLKEKENKKLKSPALVVAPLTLVENWKNEIERFAPKLNVSIYYGPFRKLQISDVDIVLTTYGVVRSDAKKLKDVKWSLIIIDEAQNVKNPNASQTKAVKSLKSHGRIALTGTPIENRLLELWSIFDFLMPGYLGNREKFIKEFSIPIEKYGNLEVAQRLQKVTAPFLMRRLKTDKTIIKDLPEKIVSNEYVQLKEEQASLYREIVKNESKKIFGEIGDMERKGAIFRLLVSLKQVCNHPINYTKNGVPIPSASGKAERTIEILKNILENNEKAVIFTQYREMGKILFEMVKNSLKVEPLFFHGGLSRRKRTEMVKDFQEKHCYPIMIITIKAGGTGLNLTAANHVIHYDLWWNPAVENQGTDRTFRIGQTKNVVIHRMITIGTLEEKIDKMIQKKQKLANSIITTGEKWITELSDEELQDLFQLEK